MISRSLLSRYYIPPLLQRHEIGFLKTMLIVNDKFFNESLDWFDDATTSRFNW